MIAVPMMAATKVEYWLLSMIPCDRPKRDAIVPKVSPVDIRRVVYIASLFGEPKSFVTGKTPTNLVAILTIRKKMNGAGAAISAGIETKVPTRMK
jgi:hypothetical protein